MCNDILLSFQLFFFLVFDKLSLEQWKNRSCKIVCSEAELPGDIILYSKTGQQ